MQFISDDGKTISQYVTDNLLAQLIETRTVPISLEQLIATQGEILLAMEELGVRAESGIRISENMVELYVLKEDDIENVLNRANIKLPPFVQIIEVDKLSTETTDIFAGLSLSTCTSGFSVQNGSGTKGITTAGHCNSSQSYNGSNLPFQGAAYGGQYDFQWHTAPGFTVRNLAFDGSNNRYIYGTKHRDNQYVGEWVCAYGKVSGYRCGQISDKNFQPHPPGCYYCFTSTFIRVHRDGVALGGQGGDSGGPWMYGNTAYGIHHGKVDSNGDGIYMAINYVSYLGLTVLTN